MMHLILDIAYSIETNTVYLHSDEVQNLLKAWSLSTKFYRLINRFHIG